MTVDDYLEGAPEPHRSTLQQIRETLSELLPDAEETMSYGMPAFKINGKAVAGFAYFKNHCSYFPHSSSVFPAMDAELDGYEWSKGTLRFPVDEALPRELVVRLVRVRRAQLAG